MSKPGFCQKVTSELHWIWGKKVTNYPFSRKQVRIHIFITWLHRPHISTGGLQQVWSTMRVLWHYCDRYHHAVTIELDYPQMILQYLKNYVNGQEESDNSIWNSLAQTIYYKMHNQIASLLILWVYQIVAYHHVGEYHIVVYHDRNFIEKLTFRIRRVHILYWI